MASWGQAGAGARAAVLAGGAVAVAAVGAVTWWASREAPSGPMPAATVMAPEAVPAPEAAPVAEPAVAPIPTPQPPTFDLVRIEADGAAQVAGRGAPMSRVVLQVDGMPVAEAEVAGDGAFVAMFTLPPNPQPSLLSLVSVLPDGTRLPGRDTVALAPIAGPEVAVAEATPTKPSPTEPPLVEMAEAPAALLVTEEGVEVLQSPIDADADVVSIDTISYAADGAVQLGGTGRAGVVVRLYLDNAAIAEAAVADTGRWSVTGAEISPGRYVLRADQLDAAGKVTSRFETPFQRETLAALAEAAAPKISALTPDTAAAPQTTPPGSVAAVVASAAPEVIAAPAPLAKPLGPALPPLVSAPAKVPAVDTLAPSEAGEASSTTPAPDPVTAAADPAPAAVSAASTSAAPPADPAPAAAPPPVSITVQPGFTLWAIAEANFGSGVRYVQVYEANKDQIRDPDLIYPGQVFKVPVEP